MVLYPRLLQSKIEDALLDTPVVCILGPRQVGKTTLSQQLSGPRSYLNFDDGAILSAARQDPTGFIQGLPPQVTLDEVQRIPELMPAIKAEVDRKRNPGRFLLTGSANLLLLPKVKESLAGRVEILHLHPLTEQEKHRQTTSFLSKLLLNQITARVTGEQKAISGVVEALCSGGYPEPNTRSEVRARQWHKQYLKTIIQHDVKDIAAIRDEDELQRLAEMLSLRTANLLNINNLANGLGIRRETTEKYLSILERLFLVRQLPAWHINQAKRLVKTPKVHWVDSGLAAVLNNVKATDWNNYSTNFGPLLESFVLQQITAQADWLEDELRISHYRDKDGLEVDIVIEQGRQVWGIEVKKAASIQPKDGAGLNRLAAKAGKAFEGGILFYCGNNCLPLAQKNCYAVPIDWLWQLPVTT